jgi:hypothetical protein
MAGLTHTARKLRAKKQKRGLCEKIDEYLRELATVWLLYLHQLSGLILLFIRKWILLLSLPRMVQSM